MYLDYEYRGIGVETIVNKGDSELDLSAYPKRRF
jgi:hypothetical protein